ncbi:MAG: glycosyltransferase [Bacteroidia bacterium]|nr:glycosyltransferase [Bacteroidia bacterium]
MDARKHICFTFAGDISRDSRLRRFASTLADAYRVSVIALSDAPSPHLQDIDVRNIPPGHSSLRRALPAFWFHAARMAEALRADLYVASDLYTLPAAARAAKAATAPLIYDSRELYTSIAALRGRALTQRFWSLIERVYAPRADTLLTVNTSIADILRGRGYGHVAVVRNVADWKAAGRENLLRSLLDIPENVVVLLSQGGLQKGRGALPMLRAVAQVSDCALVFLGDGPLASDVLQHARDKGMAERVFVLPAVPSVELQRYTVSADVGICLIEALGESYRLSLPNKLFEYLAAGLPVLASDGPEISAVIREAGAGISVNPANGQAVTQALQLLVHDRQLRGRCAENASIAAEHYTWENEKAVLLDAIRMLIRP